MKATSIPQSTRIVAYTWPNYFGRPIVEDVLRRIGEIGGGGDRVISHLSERVHTRDIAVQAVESLRDGAIVIIDNRGYYLVPGAIRHRIESELHQPDLLDNLFMLFPEDN